MLVLAIDILFTAQCRMAVRK